MELNEKTLSESVKFDGNLIKVSVAQVELVNGKKAKREVVRHRGGVCIAALTEDDELLFVKQFRYPFSKVLLELPAGTLEEGKDPLEEGKRELKEETGAVGENYISLGKMLSSPGWCSEIIHLYFCKVKSFGEICPDEDEFLNTEKIPISDAKKMVLSNEIEDAKTQIAVLKLCNYLGI